MKYLKQYEGFFDKFSKTPNENWSMNKIKNHLMNNAMFSKYQEMTVIDKNKNWTSYETPEGEKWTPIIKEVIEDNYPWLSKEEKQELYEWYFEENFFNKFEEDPKFNIGDEVYYYFNPAEHWNDIPNNPKFYKDIVKNFSVGPDNYSYYFEKNKHDNVDKHGYVSGRGSFSSMVDEEDIDTDIEALKKRIADRIDIV